VAVSSFAGSFQLGTGIVGSTKAVTGIGFQPKAVLFFWTGLTSASSLLAADHKFGAGFMISATKRGGATSQSDYAAATSASHHQTFDDAAIKLLTTAGAVDGAADFQSMDANGFTLVIDDQFVSDYMINYIAFGGTDLSADVASFSEPATPVGISPEDVVWQNNANVTVSGNDLTKTGATAWDGAAQTDKNLLSGDGYIQMTCTETTTGRMIGLTNADPFDPDAFNNYVQLDFALYVPPGAGLRVYESGTEVFAAASPYISGDILKVEIVGGVVKYYQNSTLLYTSTVLPTYPLKGAAVLYTLGSTVTDAKISGNWTEASSLGSSQDVTIGSGVNLASGRDDKAVIFFSSMGVNGSNEDVNTIYSHSGWCIGAAAGNTPVNACMGGGEESGRNMIVVGGNAWSYCDNTYCIAPTYNQSPRARALLSAWTSSGFTLTWTEISGNTLPILALVLYGASGADFRASIRTGYTRATETSVNLRPDVYSRGAVVASCGVIRHQTDVCSINDTRSLGACSSTTARAYVSLYEQTGAGSVTNMTLGQDTDGVYHNFINPGAGIVLEGTMDVSYFGHTDVRLIMDDADITPAFFWVLFVGQAQVTGVAPTIDVQMRLPNDPSSTYTPTGWWRADDLVGLYDDGQVVTSWPDASGNGRTLTLSPATTSAYLIKNSLKFGGRAALRMNTKDCFTSGLPMSTFVGGGGAITLIVVARADNVDSVGNQYLIYSANGLTQLSLSPATPNVRAVYTDAVPTTRTATMTTNYVPTPYQVHCFYYGCDTATGLYVSCDNLDFGAGGSSLFAGLMSAAALGDTFQVGGGPGGFSNFTGEIAEVIIWNVFLPQATRRVVLQYLAYKYDKLGVWNATLPPESGKDSSGSYAWRSVYSQVSAKEGMRFGYGMSGKDDDRVAAAGSLSLSMRNLTSAGAVGYYSPGHPACRVGVDIGTPIRIAITYGGTTYYKWRGRITSIDTVAGKEDKVVHVTAADWIDEAARAKVRMVPVQTAQRADQLFTTLYSLIDSPPANISIASTTDTYALSLDDTRDEAITVLTEFAKLAGSELGFVYIKRDTTQGETLVFESRTQRAAKQTNSWIVDDRRLREFKAARTRDDIRNHIKLSLHPRRLDSAATAVLFSIPPLVVSASTPSTLLYVAGAMYPDFIFPYRDEEQKGQRIGGRNMIAPVATTDYTANSAADGSGTDLTANFTVMVTFGGNSAILSVFNRGPGDAYLTKLQIRGQGVYSFENMVIEASDTASINMYGENEMSFDMPYQNSVFVASDAAYYLLNRGTKARQRPEGATFFANRDPDAMTAALVLEPGDRIGVAESTTGVFSTVEPEGYFIAGCEWDLMTPGRIHVRYRLMPADNEQVWILDKLGFSESDETTVLGFSIF
jgi:hypothetical protein